MSTMTRRAVIRADGGHQLGLGHIKRCLTLAAELTGSGVSCRFVCRRQDDGVVEEMVRAAGYPITLLPGGGDPAGELTAWNEDDSLDAELVVLDISHHETFAHADSLAAYFSGLRRRYLTVAVIDGTLNYCLVTRFDLPIDLAVIPYAAAEKHDIRARSARLALGPKYFVLDRSYAELAGIDRAIAETATRILVTAGGSDPAGITLQVLTALEQIESRGLEIRIAIGPAFADDSVSAITDAARQSSHKVDLLRQPDSLATHMAWCDMAISASGLTKYELAATGTPAILLSINKEHVDFNRPFDGFESAHHLGVATSVPTAALADAVIVLIEDASARRAMSLAGRAILDGRGAERVASELIAEMAAAHDRPDRDPSGRYIEEVIE